IVFKVVPVEGTAMVNNAPQKRAHEMAAEAVIALTLTGLRRPSDAAGQPAVNQSSCFVETHQVGVCRGPYAKELVRAWHKWDKAHGSENDPVDGLQPSQLYLVIAMADCGRDLEKAAVPGFDQARSLLAQVAMALAVGEEALEFEHRDLHWGNVMVQAAASPTINFRLKGQDIKVDTHGMTAALIDFTASRLRTLTGKLAYCNLSSDPELFEGPKGEVQVSLHPDLPCLFYQHWSTS
ncbi:protein kinase domain-containing protein, partial [Haematococcus lacustris]